MEVCNRTGETYREEGAYIDEPIEEEHDPLDGHLWVDDHLFSTGKDLGVWLLVSVLIKQGWSNVGLEDT